MCGSVGNGPPLTSAALATSGLPNVSSVISGGSGGGTVCGSSIFSSISNRQWRGEEEEVEKDLLSTLSSLLLG